MFDTMDTNRSQSGDPSHSLTVILSVGFHGVVLVSLILVPLIYTEALPLRQIRNYFLTALPSSPPPPPVHAVRIIGVERRVSEIHPNQLLVPAEIPPTVARIIDEGPPDSDPVALPDGVIGGLKSSSSAELPRWLPHLRQAAIPPPPKQKTQLSKPLRMPVSIGVQQAKLIYAPTPVYPPLARSNHIQGAVVLEAIISRDGMVQDLKVESGHPLLVPAAVDAVSQWRYRPTLLNGQPVEVITTITVNFKLGGN
ncbi:MAG: energy transducer TonB [Acidobacteriia bacterium]|nr:energy transducer TonB [Terriglobia bacterium]